MFAKPERASEAPLPPSRQRSRRKQIVPPAPSLASSTSADTEQAPRALLSAALSRGLMLCPEGAIESPGFLTLCSWVPSAWGMAPGARAQPDLPFSPTLELPSTRYAHAVSAVRETTRRAHCSDRLLELRALGHHPLQSAPRREWPVPSLTGREALHLCSEAFHVRSPPPLRWPL